MGTEGQAAGGETLKLPPEPPKANQRLMILGLVLTGVWLVVILTYWFAENRQFGELKPNEMGDFFAGAFAPLAFLWLVLGFFQQGKELRHSGEALWLQGHELQNSVEQQRELVKATREQLAFESTVLKAQQDEVARRSRPILQLTQGGSSGTAEGMTKYDFVITNHGRACTDVKAYIADSMPPVTMAVIPTGGMMQFRRTLPPDTIEPFNVMVSYIDEQLVAGGMTFRISREGRGRFEIEELSPEA